MQRTGTPLRGRFTSLALLGSSRRRRPRRLLLRRPLTSHLVLNCLEGPDSFTHFAVAGSLLGCLPNQTRRRYL